MATANIQEKEAVHGQKMIEVKLRLWTNDIAAGEGKIVPKHAWCAGVVRIEKNKAHGIAPGNPLPFHSLLDIGAVVEKCLINHGIILHPGKKMAKYVKDKA